MKVERIESIERIPLSIDYRRMYRAAARVVVADRLTDPAPIEFSLEMSPFGGHEVSVRFLCGTDYPLVPAINLLKEHIKILDKDGNLP